MAGLDTARDCLEKTIRPIFSLDKVEFHFNGILKCMVMGSNTMMMGMDPARLLRIDLAQTMEIETIELYNFSSEIEQLYYDPSGRHCIIVSTARDCYYYSQALKRAKVIPKFKGLSISALAWLYPSKSSQSALSFLRFVFGTQDGQLFEAYVDASSRVDLKKIFSFRESKPITGLSCEPIAKATEKHYFILLTTNRQMYCWISPRIRAKSIHIEPYFVVQPVVDDQSVVLVQESFAKEDHHASQLAVVQDASSLTFGHRRFAWLNDSGIFFGELDFGSESIVANARLLPGSEMPIAIALTEFHVLLLYTDKIQATCLLNQQVEYEERIGLGESEQAQGIAFDAACKTFWVYSHSTIYELVTKFERHRIWQIYLKKCLFEQAIEHCQSEEQRDIVRSAQGDALFSQQKYAESAEFYAKTSLRRFEDVALLYLKLQDYQALKTYLVHKLGHVDARKEQQLSTLGIMLVEVYFVLMNRSRVSSPSSRLLAEELHAVISSPKLAGRLQKETVYQLISDHLLDATEAEFFAAYFQDWDKMAAILTTSQQFQKAIDFIHAKQLPFLYYRFSETLFHALPRETLELWKKNPKLDHSRLLPLLVQFGAYPMELSRSNVIEYLEAFVHTESSFMPELLLHLYGQEESKDKMEALIRDTEDALALRLSLSTCHKTGNYECAALVCSRLGRFDDAVDCCLKHENFELARVYAEQPSEARARKALWLRMVRKMFDCQRDHATVLELVSKTESIDLEDILALLPELMSIELLQAHVSAVLSKQKAMLEDLELQMQHFASLSEQLRKDLASTRSNVTIVSQQDMCDYCHAMLMLSPFYAFPCSHRFHANCFVNMVFADLDGRKLKQALTLRKSIALLSHMQPADRFRLPFSVSELQDKMDAMMVEECPYCGEWALKQLDRPFIEDAMEREAWQIA